MPMARGNSLPRGSARTIAKNTIRKQIAVLAESRYAFPESRIRELLSLIKREITDEELLKFHRCMPEVLRELGNA
jgi:hypothetical protein